MSVLRQLLLVACAPLSALSAKLIVEPLAAYPGYSGSLVVGGRITVETTGMGASAQQEVSFSLRGVDPACDNATGGPSVPNSCGIHIHEGTSCDSALGHYWNKVALGSDSSNDPWQPVMYEVNSAVATGSITAITGASHSDIMNRVMVVHDFSGGRVACAAMRATVASGGDLEVSSMSAYPGYGGNLTVMGTATIATSGSGAASAQAVSFSITGGDPSCGTADVTGVANACGIHLHEGGNCLSAAAIGGHYWDRAAITNDPWATVMYDASTAASATVTVVTGLSAEEVDGSLLVIHDVDGVRVACAVVTPVAVTTTMAQSTVMVAATSTALGKGLLSSATILALLASVGLSHAR